MADPLKPRLVKAPRDPAARALQFRVAEIARLREELKRAAIERRRTQENEPLKQPTARSKPKGPKARKGKRRPSVSVPTVSGGLPGTKRRH